MNRPSLLELSHRVGSEMEQLTRVRDVPLGEPQATRMSPDDVERRRLEGAQMHAELLFAMHRPRGDKIKIRLPPRYR
jgi:hypothetical protein